MKIKNPYNQRIEALNDLSKIWEDLVKVFEEENIPLIWQDDYEVRLSGGLFEIVVSISKLEHLSLARKLIKKVFPEWKDVLKSIHPNGEHTATMVWRVEGWGEPIHKIEIRLSLPQSEVPTNLLPSPECKFQKVVHESWELVCPPKEEKK